MQGTVNQRLKIFASEVGLTQYQISKDLKMPDSQIGSIFSGSVNVGAQVLIRFAVHYGLSTDWLIFGDGDMFRKGFTKPEVVKAKKGRPKKVVENCDAIANSAYFHAIAV